MTSQQSNSQGPQNSRQALVGLGTVVLFGVLLEQVATLVRHLLSCLAGQLVQALPWTLFQTCHSLQGNLPDPAHLLTCYNLLAAVGPLLCCALGLA